jgi:hypothetical protein
VSDGAVVPVRHSQDEEADEESDRSGETGDPDLSTSSQSTSSKRGGSSGELMESTS